LDTFFEQAKKVSRPQGGKGIFVGQPPAKENSIYWIAALRSQ
jgi:hypothetical protein